MNLFDVKKILSLLKFAITISPNWLFNIIYFIFGKYYKVERVNLYRFLLNFSLSKQPEKKCIYSIGYYDYEFVSMCFVCDVMGNLLSSLEKGYLPLISVKNSSGENLWDLFFEQFSVNDLLESEPLKANLRPSKYCPGCYTIEDDRERKMWGDFFNHFLKLNQSTKLYIDEEYYRIIPKNERVLGVLCRGTDYIKLKPKGHPVQPTPEMIISHAKKKMEELSIKYIYLATEEKRIEQEFENAFPNHILTNKREYYDDQYYSNSNITHVGEVKFDRENDSYLKSLEYLSSIVILSRCNALIAGNTTGSSTALIMNNEKYEYFHVFHLGIYE